MSLNRARLGLGQLRWACIALFLLIGTAPAQAQDQDFVPDLSQPGDYDIENRKGWNGLYTLASLAEGSGLQVVQYNKIDWKELGNDDLVLLLYPTSWVDAGNVVRFVRNGGRVLIADDFGSGAPIFGVLGGGPSDIRADEYFDNQLFAPVAHPTGTHPLSQGVLQLTTNHPGAIRTLEAGMTSVFEFSEGSTLVATRDMGAGRIVALSDPSILINCMLQFEGNLEFSINLLNYLREGRVSNRLVVLSGYINLTGVPRNQVSDGTWRSSASVQLSTVDEWLLELNSWYFTPRYLRIIGVVFALLLSVLVVLTLPVSRQRTLDGSWTKPGAEDHKPLSESYQSAGARTNFLLPAAIERDNVNTALELALTAPEPLYAFSEQELLSRSHRDLGLNTTLALKKLLPKLRNIPQRAQAASHWEPRFLGRTEFEAIHHSAALLFEQLEATDET